MPRTKVLILIKGMGIGGAEKLISEAIPFWDRDRFDYEVAYLLPWKDQLVPELTEAGVRVTQLGNGRMGLSTLRAVRRHLVESAPDLVHAHLPITGILARILSPAPVIYTEHNVASSYRSPTRQLNRLTYRRNARTIAVSDAVAEAVSGFAQPITIPNGVSVSVSDTERLRVRAEMGIDPTTVLIAHVGNIRPHKGHQNLIEATAFLKEKIDSFLVVSIGGEKNPGDLDRIRSEAERRGLNECFRALGRREDALAFLAAADLVANPSDHEGLPLAVLEAMSLGTPVVATSVGGVPSIIDSGSNGVMVPPGDPTALALALAELARDPEMRQRLGGRAQEDALARHGLEAMVRAVEAVYLDLITNQSGPEKG